MRFLLVDRILRFDDGREAVVRKNVSNSEDYFADHFDGRPIMPGRIAFITAAGLAAPQVHGSKPDILVANILLNPLIKLAPAIAGCMRTDGIAVLSGILEKQEAALMAAYRNQGFFLLKRFRRNGWSALVVAR